MNKVMLGGGIALGVGLVAALAYAQAVGVAAASPRLIPYVGHLDHDGQPVTGKVAMKVCLVGSPSIGCDVAAWSEQFESVDVAGGQFSLVLGQSVPIPDGIYDAPAGLYVRAMVGAHNPNGEPTFVQLSGAQRVLSVPYAINVNQAASLRTEGPIYKGSVVPPVSNLGLYSQAQGEGMRFVTNGADITFSRSGNTVNQFNPPAQNNLLTLQSNGVVLGENSFPIRKVTYCRQIGSNLATPNKQIEFVDGECSHGLPVGTCLASMTKTADCGGAVSWTVVHPQDNGGKAGMRWYNESNCNTYEAAALFFCAY